MKTANLAIVFTDIKGFTERTSRQTLEQNQTLLRTHHDLLAPVFRAFHGKIIKEIGDAFLVTFESPTQAVLAGVALQDKLWAHNRSLSGDHRIDVRVAINCGEVRVEHNDVFGEPVNIAARVEGLADAGEVYLTESVYLAMNKAEVPSEEVGLFDLKGIPGKIRVFKVPHAPYRVAPVVSGTAPPVAEDDAPPYGNLGLSKMPDGAGAELTAKAVQLGAAAMHGGEVLVKRAVHEMSTLDGASSMKLVRRGAPIALALVALLLVVSMVRWLSGSSLQSAVLEVEQASAEEKNAKIEAVLALLAKEKNVRTQQYWSGRLQEARDELESALKHYKSAAQNGSTEAEDRLISLLEDRRCGWRSDVLELLGELKLQRARPKIEALADKGGADDQQQLFGIGCNSRSKAASVLRKLE